MCDLFKSDTYLTEWRSCREGTNGIIVPGIGIEIGLTLYQSISVVLQICIPPDDLTVDHVDDINDNGMHESGH